VPLFVSEGALLVRGVAKSVFEIFTPFFHKNKTKKRQTSCFYLDRLFSLRKPPRTCSTSLWFCFMSVETVRNGGEIFYARR
jgi:hypothetical protein